MVFRSKCSVLYCKKCLRHCWAFSAPPSDLASGTLLPHWYIPAYNRDIIKSCISVPAILWVPHHNFLLSCKVMKTLRNTLFLFSWICGLCLSLLHTAYLMLVMLSYARRDVTLTDPKAVGYSSAFSCFTTCCKQLILIIRWPEDGQTICVLIRAKPNCQTEIVTM